MLKHNPCCSTVCWRWSSTGFDIMGCWWTVGGWASVVSSTSVTNGGGGQTNLEDLSPLDPPPDDLPHLSTSRSQPVSAKCIEPSIPKAETSPSIPPSNTHYLWIPVFTWKFPVSLSSRLTIALPKNGATGSTICDGSCPRYNGGFEKRSWGVR